VPLLILQRWGRVTRPIKDRRDLVAVIYRYRCWDCKRTFRYYPDNVDSSNYSLRIRQLAALIQMMGLSYREVAEFFEHLGINLSRMTIWREAQALADRNFEDDEDSGNGFLVDKEFIPNVSPKFGVVVVVDLGQGKRAVLGTLNEHNPFEVLSWMKPYAKDVDIEIRLIGTGYLNEVPSDLAEVH